MTHVITPDMNYKKDGFDGQRAIVLPRSIVHAFCEENEIVNRAHITDLGYYPKAKAHYRKRPHGSHQNILIYCVDGKGEATIGGKCFEVNPGNFFVIPSHMAHSYKSDENSPWTIYWSHFKGEQADTIVDAIIKKEGSFNGRVEFIDERIAIFDKLYYSLEMGYSYDNLTYINIMFLQFLSSFLFGEKISSKHDEVSQDFLEKSIRYMQDNIDKNLTLADFATSANYSSSHYSFLFRSETGFSPMGYFNQLKVQKSCQYLQFTNLRIKEISFKIGISDAYYFSRLFRKTMGFSPKDYRLSRNQKN